MKLIDYLKYRSPVIAAFILFAVLIVVCQLLCGMPLEVLWYPLGLCALAGIGFLTVGYLRQRQSCEKLRQIRNLPANSAESLPADPAEDRPAGLMYGLPADLMEDLPPPLSPEAEQYQRIIRDLCDGIRQQQAGLDQRYDDMIDYFSLWAHQIKTPIAAMKLSFQNEDSDLARQSLNDLNRIEQYVDMVMTYLKLDSEDLDYVIREHSLDDIIRPVIRGFAGEFISRKIRLEYEPAEYMVLTDDKWLGFVIEQILSNALKYTREGSIRIYMEQTSLCIKDSGIGIDAADLPRIFEKGFTGFNGRNERRASGIGLYLCKRICDNLNHEISAESTVGVGSTIRIDLAQEHLGIE